LPFYTSTTNTTSNPSRRSVFFIPLPLTFIKSSNLGKHFTDLEKTHTHFQEILETTHQRKNPPRWKFPPQMIDSNPKDDG
jgi:hypothetical protein